MNWLAKRPGWNARFPHPSKWHDAIMFARERGGWEHERNERESLGLAPHVPWKEGWRRGKPFNSIYSGKTSSVVA